MPARLRASTKDSIANLGFDATAMRGSATLIREATLQSASVARDNFGSEHADTFREFHPDPVAHFSARYKKRSQSVAHPRCGEQRLANPPFNASDWFGRDDDERWQMHGTNSNTKRSWR
jgi:hypothetical protein